MADELESVERYSLSYTSETRTLSWSLTRNGHTESGQRTCPVWAVKMLLMLPESWQKCLVMRTCRTWAQ